MSHTLYLTPHQTLHLRALEESEPQHPIADKQWLNIIVDAFAANPDQGLFTLAAQKTSCQLPPTMSYWRSFSELYLAELCKISDHFVDHAKQDSEKLLPNIAPVSKLSEMELILSAPPMQGGEYLSAAALDNLWEGMDSWVREDLIRSKLTLHSWLQKNAPHWHQVGRVCFHLAENKKDPEYPFAFMATYAASLSQQGELQHQALGQALKKYAGKENKRTLENLLSPIQRAAKTLPFVEEMVESSDIFYPLSWTPDEALQLLRHTEELEAAGLVVKLPNWWKKRTQAAVKISIGNDKKKNFGMDAMLDFKVNLSLGEQELSKQEWQQLMEANESLLFIKGQWVEVDKEKLQEALEHWQQVEAEAAGDGLSFLEGMRLLAGAPSQIGSSIPEDEETKWAMVEAGSWLKDTLNKLRRPDSMANASLSASQKSASKNFRGTLRPYQQTGKDWLYFLVSLGLGGCLADDMGLGKTVQIISLLTTLKEESRGKLPPSILVLPASLIANWKAEINKFSPDLTALVIHPSITSKEELKQIAVHPEKSLAAADVVLTTYGMLLRQAWLVEQSWQLAILDEAQAIKNPNSRQTKAVKQLHAKSRIALTGTPVENNLSDLWSLFDYITPGLLGKLSKFKQFTKSLEERQRDQFTPLRNLISPYILRRLKTDKSIISDLPDKTEIKTYCGLSKQQAALYQASVDELKESLENLDGMQRRGLIFSFLMRFKQICNHPSQLLGNQTYPLEQSGKLERLQDICEEIAQRQEKVLVFTQFKEMTQPLADALEQIFGRPGLTLHGGTSVKKRKQMVEQFQDEDGPPFFVLSLKAGGTGLTLTAASHVIHFDRWWNPAVENQATDRAFRIGQKRNVLVHKFICKGTLEEKIDALIEEKTSLANELLEGEAPALLTEMSDEQLMQTVCLDIEQTSL